MTLADDLKPLVWSIRAIPGNLGLRPYSVAIVNGYKQGTHTGDLTIFETTSVTEGGGQSPRVRWLSDEEVALAGIGHGLVEIGPITPSHTGDGTDLGLLTAAELDAGDVLHVLITGPKHPDGAVYRVVKVTADRALQYRLTCRPVGESV